MYLNGKLKISILGSKQGSYSEHTVKKFIESLQRKYKYTDFVMLNSLAAGADTICAEVAIELGIEIICPLPLVLGEYEEDFEGENLLKFRELIQKCKKSFLVNSDYQNREEGYGFAGKYISENCNLLMAIWDGVINDEAICGTGKTVKSTIEQNIASSKLLASSRVVPIYHIKVQKHPSNSISTFEKMFIDNIEDEFSEINEFNKDVATQTIGNGYSVFPKSVLPVGLAEIDRVYRAADSLSLLFQRKYFDVLKAISIFSAVLVISYLLYDEGEMLYMLIVYPLVLIIYYLLYKGANRLEIHKKYYSYRMFAETLRVQLHLLAAGIKNSVVEYISWIQISELSWIENAMISIFNEKLTEYKEIGGIELKKHWIDSQRNYHEKSAFKKEKQLMFNDRVVNLMLVLTLILYVIVVVAEFKYGDMMEGLILNISIRSWTKILWGFFAAIALLSTNYYGKLSLDRQIADHKKMAKLYKSASIDFELKEVDNNELFRKLAQEEIEENGEWMSYVTGNSFSFGI